jgi:hypothetical protein
MATYDYPIFELEASFPGSTGTKTGRFEFKKATVVERIRTGLLVDNGFDDLLGGLSQFVDGMSGRQGISLDSGGGQHVYEIDLQSLGAVDGQWGYTDDRDTLGIATATGGDRIQKMQVLNNYLRYGTPDSENPATLIYGEYGPDGQFGEGISVVPESPEVTAARDESSVYDVSITLIDTLDLSDAISSTVQPE